MRHFVLKSVLLVCFISALTLSSAVDSRAEDGVIGSELAFEQMQAGGLTVIDIRRHEEWLETGIPQGGHAITMHDPDGQEAFLANVLSALDGDRTAPVGLICASGVRSTWASGYLARNGFTNVYNIREGMLGRGRQPGWIAHGLPVESYSE